MTLLMQRRPVIGEFNVAAVRAASQVPHHTRRPRGHYLR
jgi:hypothetical protein